MLTGKTISQLDPLTSITNDTKIPVEYSGYTYNVNRSQIVSGYATTGSNTFSGSLVVSGSINVTNGITGSLLGTATTASYIKNAQTASLAFTSSYLLADGDGVIDAMGNIVPVTTNTYALGSALNYWKDIYVSTGSIYFVDQNNAIVSTLSSTTNGASLGQSLESTDTGVQFKKLIPAGTIQAWTVGSSMNTARYAAVGVGSQTTALVAGGSSPSISGQRTHYNTSEEYSGGVWTTAANLPNTASAAAGAGTQTAALVYGGQRASFNTGMVNTYAYDGSTWSSRNNMVVDQFQAGGFGTQNAAISFGGYSSSSLNSNNRYTQTYDGTSWSTATSLESSTQAPAGVGNLDAGLAIGGQYFGTLTTVQEWTVNVWSLGSNLNTGRSAPGAAGTSTSAVVFGGAVDGSGPSGVPTDVTEYWNGTTWSTGNSLVFGTIYPGAAGSSNTAAIGFGGSGPNRSTDSIANTQIYGSVQQYDTENSLDFNSSTGGLTIEGPVSINNVLTLESQNPLPAANLYPNSFAVSGSKPYFSDGSQWFSLY